MIMDFTVSSAGQTEPIAKFVEINSGI